MNSYRGYDPQIEYDADARTFHGSVANIRGAITFAGDTVDDLERAFHDSVDCYLDLCERKGIDPARPYSGTFVVRLDPEVHGRAALAASRSGQSLNAWVAIAITSALDSATARDSLMAQVNRRSRATANTNANAKKSVAKKSVAKKAVAKKAVSKKVAAKKTVAKRAVAKKAVAKKSISLQPVVKKRAVAKRTSRGRADNK